MILNAKLETLQQDEVLTRFEQLPSLPPGYASFRDLGIWCLGITALCICTHGKPWPSHPFQCIESELPPKAVGELLALANRCWHAGIVIHY